MGKLCLLIYMILVFYRSFDYVKGKDSTSNKNEVEQKKLREVIAIRQQLSEAFEKTERTHSSSSQGAVVQPKWTLGENYVQNTTTVTITPKKLKDTAKIRDEIQRAVANNFYIEGESAYNAKKADHLLGMQFNKENFAINMTGGEKLQPKDYEYETVGLWLNEEDGVAFPNVVESNALANNFEFKQFSQLETSMRREREILSLSEIVEDPTFELGENITEWKHVQHLRKEFYVGLRDKDLLVVQRDAMDQQKEYVISIGAEIQSIETYSLWNVETEKQEGLIVAAVQERVLWFLVQQEEIYWNFSIGVQINALKYFTIGPNEYLALAVKSYSPTTGLPVLIIYQLNTKSKDLWIAQMFQLEVVCSEIAVLDSGIDMLLVVAQNNTARVYSFRPRFDAGNHIKFIFKTSIESKGIQSISGFQMGGKTYLALGGLSPQILQYSNGRFQKKTILGQNFGLVEYFLPVPARTYRDDLLLLVQHRVNFDSHDLIVLDTLIWNGNAFEGCLPMPCSINGNIFDFGASCMLDIRHEAGIKGSLVVKYRDESALIIPRHKAQSGLFHLKTKLISKNSDLLDLTDAFSFLREWVKEQNQLVKTASNVIENWKNLGTDDTVFKYSTLRTLELVYDGDIQNIFLNEHELKPSDSKMNHLHLLNIIDNIDTDLEYAKDIARNRRDLTYDTLEFDNVDAATLDLDLINSEKPYLNTTCLVFDGTVSFATLSVLDKMRLSSVRTSTHTEMEVDGSLHMEEVNGFIWNEVMDEVILRNLPLKVQALRVKGEVVAEGNIELKTLNNIEFPDSFMLSSGLSTGNIRAEKIFNGAVATNAVDTGLLINGLNPFNIITLSETQNVPGLTEFSQLEVSERIEVNGTVRGRGLNNFLSNPSILDSNIIQSACSFRQIEIRGQIFVQNSFNGNNFNKTLNDIVYDGDAKNNAVSLWSKKSFESVSFGTEFKLTESTLHNIPIQFFVSENSNQKLKLKHVMGNAYFRTLTTGGKFDSVDIEELLRNSLKIHEDLLLGAEIEFSSAVKANSIMIFKSLNDIMDLRKLNDHISLKEALFDEVFIDSASVLCHIDGNGKLNNFSLKEKSTKSIPKIYVESLILNNGLKTEIMHNINTEYLVSFMVELDNTPDMLSNGKIIIDDINIEGNILVKNLNRQTFSEETLKTLIWLNRVNLPLISMKFQKPVTSNFHSHITKRLAKSNFSSLLNDMVFKTNDLVVLSSDKYLTTTLNILQEADIENFDDVPFTEIATTQSIERFLGTFVVNGNFIAEDLQVLEHLNEYPVATFGKSIRYDESLKVFIFVGEVLFKTHFHLDNLSIGRKLNSKININELFENIVYKNNICMLKGKTSITGNVTIEKGAYIRNLNGHNMVQLMKNIVFIQNPEPIFILASVMFHDIVRAKDVTIKGSLAAENHSFSIQEWLVDTLRTNKAFDIVGKIHFAPWTLEVNSLHTVFINTMDTDYMIPLNSSQSLSKHVKLSNVHLAETIKYSESIKGINLREEKENTLMTYGEDQYITAPLTVQSCSIQGSMKINNVINNSRYLGSLVNLHTQIDLKAPLIFRNLSANNILTSDVLSSISYNEWHKNSLWKKGQRHNNISGNWNIKNLYASTIFLKDQANDEIMRSKNYLAVQYDYIQKILTSFNERQHRIRNDNQRKIFFLKYFLGPFSLATNVNSSKIFSISNSNNAYIIVNSQCQSEIYCWDSKKRTFSYLCKFDSGAVSDVISVSGANNTFFLVTKSDDNAYECPYVGVNSWKFHGKSVSHFRNFYGLNITEIHQTFQTADTFFALEHENGKVLELSSNATEIQYWQLPYSDGSLYRFLPNNADLGMALTNGRNIFLISRNQTKSKTSDRKVINLPSFHHIIKRILRDLVGQLNFLLTETPPSLLMPQKKYFSEDLADLIESIYGQKTLSKLEFLHSQKDKTQFPSTPSQIANGKLVQVFLPVFSEIEELKSLLHNKDHDHQIIKKISQDLLWALHEILELGKLSKETVSLSHITKNISETLCRVQELQSQILKAIDGLVSEKHNGPHLAPTLLGLLQLNSTNLNESFISRPVIGRNVLITNSPPLPARGSGEILFLRTGLLGSIKTLTAISTAKDGINLKEHFNLKIYFDVLTEKLFQSIAANEPSFLTAFRIENESFLAFVENKRIIHILVYRGVQGFVDFAELSLFEDISGLQFVSFKSHEEMKCTANFLVVSRKQEVSFYELITSGYCSSAIYDLSYYV